MLSSLFVLLLRCWYPLPVPHPCGVAKVRDAQNHGMAGGGDGPGFKSDLCEHLDQDFRNFLNADIMGADAGVADVIDQPLDVVLLIGFDMGKNWGEGGVHGGPWIWDWRF